MDVSRKAQRRCCENLSRWNSSWPPSLTRWIRALSRGHKLESNPSAKSEFRRPWNEGRPKSEPQDGIAENPPAGGAYTAGLAQHRARAPPRCYATFPEHLPLGDGPSADHSARSGSESGPGFAYRARTTTEFLKQNWNCRGGTTSAQSVPTNQAITVEQHCNASETTNEPGGNDLQPSASFA
jgi:hypothetical protein